MFSSSILKARVFAKSGGYGSERLGASIPERAVWLQRLPVTIRSLEHRWSITSGPPFDSEAAWVAPVSFADGKSAVLKLGMPHMEGAHEIQGMLFWNGDPTARVLNVDNDSDAFLLAGPTERWSVKDCTSSGNCRARPQSKYCLPPTCTQGMSCARRESRGSLSIQSHSSAIRLMM
jgi:hypothetical protein